MRSLSARPRRHGRAMHRAIKRHKEKMAFDNWICGEMDTFIRNMADQSARTAHIMVAFISAMEEFRKGVHEAFRKAHESLLASGHRPQYLGETLLPERAPLKFIH